MASNITKKPYVNTFATTRLTPIEESMGWRLCRGGCDCSFDDRKVPHAHQYAAPVCAKGGGDARS